ncbi:hypothetical protein [Streptomyces sp. enrichment culture]|uniref:hypothetical protein n=1 Tax=Streptomyces sp. enrichment culture TaxID=1795815 RepID=UPI003F57E66B
MTDRRALGPGPDPTTLRRAAQADLADLPAVPLPDLDELRRRGVLSARPPGPAARRPRFLTAEVRNSGSL